jgi:hypothetical protein
MTAAPINEISALQRKLAPQSMTEFESRFPSIAEEMKGFKAGEVAVEPSPNQGQVVQERARAKAIFTQEIIQNAEAACEQGLVVARRNIRVSRTIKTVGQIFSLGGTGAVIGCLGLGKPNPALITSIITLLAAIATLISDYVIAVPGDDGKTNAHDVYQELVAARFDLHTSGFELATLERYSASPDEIEAKVGEINAVCRTVNKNVGNLLVRLLDAHQFPERARTNSYANAGAL